MAITESQSHFCFNLQPALKCVDPACKICPMIQNPACLKPGGNPVCEAKGVVYALSCVLCHRVYVGQTGRQLRARISEHMCKIKYKTKIVTGIKLLETACLYKKRLRPNKHSMSSNNLAQDNLKMVFKYYLTVHNLSCNTSCESMSVAVLAKGVQDTKTRCVLEKTFQGNLASFVPQGLNKR